MMAPSEYGGCDKGPEDRGASKGRDVRSCRGGGSCNGKDSKYDDSMDRDGGDGKLYAGRGGDGRGCDGDGKSGGQHPAFFRGPGRRLGKYVEMFKITLVGNLVYVQDVLARQVFLIIIMYVFVQLWTTTYRWEGAAAIAGFSMPQMIWYLALSESIVMGVSRTGAEIDSEVKSGSLAYSLTKPYDYTLFNYAKYMGGSVVRFFMNLCIAGGVSWVLVGIPKFTLPSVLAGLVSVLLGFTLDYWIQLCLGLGAFWVEDTWAFRILYSRITMLLGGMMLPLDVFPEWLRRIASALPVSSIVYGPVSTFLRFNAQNWLSVLLRQGLWIAAIVALSRATFGMGVKKVNVQGG